MKAKTTYRTRQRQELLDYLRSSHGAHITAGEVCEYFRGRGVNIGQSTVYRQLERMVDEGVLNKYVIDGQSPACFEFVGEDTRSREEPCFHCKCEKCGRLFHLDCHELRSIQGHLQQRHRFSLDPRRTVFYGLCDDCR